MHSVAFFLNVDFYQHTVLLIVLYKCPILMLFLHGKIILIFVFLNKH